MIRGNRHKLLLMVLCVCPLAISGCGLGWAYMRYADSQRIKGLRVLTYSTAKDRFSDAEHFYKNAVYDYRESILYDDTGNPAVYSKLGFTLLMLTPPQVPEAEMAFRDGMKVLRAILDKSAKSKPLNIDSGPNRASDAKEPPAVVAGEQQIEKRTAEEVALDLELEREDSAVKAVTKAVGEDYSQCNAGLGTVAFLRGIKDQSDEQIALALRYYRVAEKFSTHPNFRKKNSIIEKMLAYFDLNELVNPVPFKVLEARVLHYKTRKLLEKGLLRLADSTLGEASDALEAAKAYYEYDPRYVLEMAQWHYWKGELARLQGTRVPGGDANKEYDSAIAMVDSAKNSNLGYSDLREAALLKGEALIRKGKVADSEPIAQSILDKNPSDTQALLIMAHVYSAKGKAESNNLSSVVDAITKDPDTKDNPYILKEIGDCFQEMGDSLQAKSYYLQAYQHDSKNIYFLYALGNIYQTLGESTNMKDCFGKVCQIEPSSAFCAEVKKWTQ